MDLNLTPIYDGEVHKIREVTLWRDEEDDTHHDVDKVVSECHVCSKDPQVEELFVLCKLYNQTYIFMIITRNFMPSKASVDAAIINNIHQINHEVERSSLVKPSTSLNVFNFIGKSMELPKPPYDVIIKKLWQLTEIIDFVRVGWLQC